MEQPKDVGFELLLPEEYIPISRFPPHIRWLHWINAALILLLYALAVNQIVELHWVGHFIGRDSRFLHWAVGLIWIGLLIVLSLLLVFGDHFKVSEGVVSDKLIIQQKAFLLLSMGFVFFMIASGLGLFFLRGSDAPYVRSILLLLHFLVSAAYLPALGMHIYLATVKSTTRRSLKTMISDINMEYALHLPIDGLQCQVSDDEQTLFLHAEVIDISITRFRAKLKKGAWEEWLDVSKMTTVDFIHPDLSHPVRLPIKGPRILPQDDHSILKCKYNLETQESARILLSHAFFFRKLFLEEDHAFQQTFENFIQSHT